MFLKWFQDESYHNWFQDASNQRLIVLRGSPESCDCILRSLEPADLGGGGSFGRLHFPPQEFEPLPTQLCTIFTYAFFLVTDPKKIFGDGPTPPSPQEFEHLPTRIYTNFRYPFLVTDPKIFL